MPTVRGPIDVSKSKHALLQPLPESARLTAGFAQQRQKVNREVSIAHGFAQLEAASNLRNMRIAAGKEQGEFVGGWPFQDSDISKWQEAAGFEIGNGPAPEISQWLESSADLVASAQQPNGYLNTWYQIKKQRAPFSNLKDDHEMYNAGHLFQAAVAAHRNAGHGKLLEISLKFANLLLETFGPDKREGLCGHPEVETALFELARETGDTRFAELSGLMIDRRGKRLIGGGEYHQDHKPVRDVDELVGHAVRQLYLNAGVADYFIETGEVALLDAQKRLLDDLFKHKLYVTGGIGARHAGEAFGERYELPNEQAYCETCAQLAGFFWAWRMLLATGDVRCADLMEHLFFNSIASGLSLDGSMTFYVNPLATRGGHGRVPWHKCACCPPNIMRTLSSLGHYVATTRGDAVQIHQYFAGNFSAPLASGTLKATIETNYPWEETVRVKIDETPQAAATVALRIPAWCVGATLKVNGKEVPLATSDGYAPIARTWSRGDTIELTLPMPTRWLEAHPAIESVRGQVALQRGPITYCVEAVDLAGDTSPDWLMVDPTAKVETKLQPDLLGGVVSAHFGARTLDRAAWDGHLYRPAGGSVAGGSSDVMAVPYAVWCNRGPKAMRVWLRSV